MYDFDDILKAKKLYSNGNNIIKSKLSSNINITKLLTNKDIELAYDLQAGNYINNALRKKEWLENFSLEAAKIIDHYISQDATLLDAGTGELTSFSNILNSLENKVSRALAFDLSLSRLFLGMKYMKKIMNKSIETTIFCAELSKIPLPENSVDTAITIHAVEPNNIGASEIIQELMRVSRDNLLLFEPYYEKSNTKVKKRMNEHNYVRGIEEIIKMNRGKIVDIIEILNSESELNKTFCFVVDVKHLKKNNEKKAIKFTYPGREEYLEKLDSFYFSKETGYIFPEIKKIPILKLDTALLASKIL